MTNLTEKRKEISLIFKKYGVKRASVFGSIARGEESSKSDVDILISLGKPIGLINYVRMKRELENVLERSVDLITDKSARKFLSPYIDRDLKTIYEG